MSKVVQLQKKIRGWYTRYFSVGEIAVIDGFIQTASGEVEPMQIEARRADHSFCRAK